MNTQLSPLEPPFGEDIAAILDTYPKQDGYLLKLFRVFANSKRFLTKGVVNLLDKGSPITLRDREIVILRTCANNDCEYEWGVHVAIFAGAARLTPEEIEATRCGDHQSACWNAEEANLIRAVDQLCSRGRMSSDTHARFRQNRDVAQQLEIMALCGNYHTISFVANTAALERESFAARFPDCAG